MTGPRKCCINIHENDARLAHRANKSKPAHGGGGPGRRRRGRGQRRPAALPGRVAQPGLRGPAGPVRPSRACAAQPGLCGLRLRAPAAAAINKMQSAPRPRPARARRRTVYGKSSFEGMMGASARCASSPCPSSRRPGVGRGRFRGGRGGRGRGWGRGRALGGGWGRDGAGGGLWVGVGASKRDRGAEEARVRGPLMVGGECAMAMGML
jgi:hypothetical protein